MTSRSLRQIAREVARPAGSDMVSRSAFWLLLLFVAAAPFAYGISAAERPLAWMAGSFTSVGTMRMSFLALLVAGMTLLSRSPLTLSRPLAPALGAVAALALLGAIQLLPLPEGVLGTVAPTNLEIYHETSEILRLFGRSVVPTPRVSIAPMETLGALLVLLSCVGLLVSAASLLSTRPRRRLFARVLLCGALLQTLLAWIGHPGSVPLAVARGGQLSGYLEIALGVAFALFWAEVLTNRDRADEARGLAERLERRLAPLAARAFLGLLIAASIVGTGFRGGILAALLSTATVTALAVVHRRSRVRGRAATVTAVILLFAALAASIAISAPRFARFLESGARADGAWSRVAIWKTTAEAIRRFPIVGSGLGTFPDAFRRGQPRELPGVVGDANGDLLDVAVTGGLVGAALAVVLFCSLAVALLRAWRGQMHREESAFVLGGFGALLCLALHGLVDSNLSVPVIPATLACVVGASWAAGARR